MSSLVYENYLIKDKRKKKKCRLCGTVAPILYKYQNKWYCGKCADENRKGECK